MNTLSLRLCYRQIAVRWQDSARFWRETAARALADNDTARAIFAHQRAQQCEAYAVEDAQKAEVFA